MSRVTRIPPDRTVEIGGPLDEEGNVRVSDSRQQATLKQILQGIVCLVETNQAAFHIDELDVKTKKPEVC